VHSTRQVNECFQVINCTVTDNVLSPTETTVRRGELFATHNVTFEVLYQATVTSHGVCGHSLPIPYRRSSNNNDDGNSASLMCRRPCRRGISCARPRRVTIATDTHLLHHYTTIIIIIIIGAKPPRPLLGASSCTVLPLDF